MDDSSISLPEVKQDKNVDYSIALHEAKEQEDIVASSVSLPDMGKQTYSIRNLSSISLPESSDRSTIVYSPLSDSTDSPINFAARGKQNEIVRHFRRYFIKTENDMMVAAVLALSEVVKNLSTSTPTILFANMRTAIDALISYMNAANTMAQLRKETASKRLTPLPLISALEVYQQFARRLYEDHPNITFENLRYLIVLQAQKFQESYTQSRRRLIRLGAMIFQVDQAIILTHGRSACVEDVVKHAVEIRNVKISLIISRHTGVPEDVDLMKDWERKLSDLGIPTRYIDVTDVGNVMPRVSCVVVGAEAVTEDGGVINRAGTSVIATLAKTMNKPFYVVCEVVKFMKLKALEPEDIEAMNLKFFPPGEEMNKSEMGHQGLVDRTPPELISLLFTDLGVFTPAGVADQLTLLYHRGKQADVL